jgi:hypothetical protein
VNVAIGSLDTAFYPHAELFCCGKNSCFVKQTLISPRYCTYYDADFFTSIAHMLTARRSKMATNNEKKNCSEYISG